MYEKLREKDLTAIWHPYTNMRDFKKNEFPIIKKGEGVFLYTVDNKKVYDGISSWWCVNLGHSHPRLTSTIKKQAEVLQHSILGGMSNDKAILLAEAIKEIVPVDDPYMFFAGDGTSATEIAIRGLIEYAHLKDIKKNKFLSIKDGYHGDSLGSISFGYLDKFHKNINHLINKGFIADSPHCSKCPSRNNCDRRCFKSIKSIIENNHEEILSVIIEPLCQGAAGIRIYDEWYIQELRKLCDKFDILLIADEIAVGFGRTGSMFACERASIKPDVMLIGKGLSGGYLPISCAIFNGKIFNEFINKNATLFFGNTFCGNPICSALSLEAIKVYKDEKVIDNVNKLEPILFSGIKKIAEKLNAPFKVKGLMSSIEIVEDDNLSNKIASLAYSNGLLIRPLGNTIYLWPPLNSSESELKDMLFILDKTVSSL